MLRSDAVRGFRYILLDEVHERTIEDDLLLAFLCQDEFLSTGTKVIIMSAIIMSSALSTKMEWSVNNLASHAPG